MKHLPIRSGGSLRTESSARSRGGKPVTTDVSARKRGQRPNSALLRFAAARTRVDLNPAVVSTRLRAHGQATREGSGGLGTRSREVGPHATGDRTIPRNFRETAGCLVVYLPERDHTPPVPAHVPSNHHWNQRLVNGPRLWRRVRPVRADNN